MSLYWYSLKSKTRYNENPNLEHAYPCEDIPNPGKGLYFCFPDGIVELKDTECAGRALYAKRDIKKGELIWRYDFDGKATEVLDIPQIWAMPKEERENWLVYSWQMDEDSFGGPSRVKQLSQSKQGDAVNFFNHSCDPNIGFDGPFMMRSMKDVKEGELLTYDYMMSDSIVPLSFKCLCGTEKCRGFVGNFDHRNPVLQKNYEGRVLPLVKKLYEIEKRATLGTGPCRELNEKLVAKPCADNILGRGVFAEKKILKGEPIWIAQSLNNTKENIMSLQEINSLSNGKREFAITYGQEIDEDEIGVPIDVSAVEDNYFYLINHSCDPNAVVYSQFMWLAFKDILPGEEITIDYATLGYQIQRIPEKCLCGTSCCRGSVTKEDYKNKQLQERYGKGWRPHVLAKIWKLYNQN